MANGFFQFKQFTIRQDQCAMKVGTDGVLLGAWAPVEQFRSILDVGTGTGLIALMAAQRSDAIIDAIDMDEDACRQAEINSQASPFARRIQVYHASLETFCQTTEKRYDCILSNPPYFQDSLKCPDPKRNAARHTDTLPLAHLLSGSRRLLTENGRLCLILPSDREEKLKQLLTGNGLYLLRQTNVIPIPEASPKRLLAEIALTPPLHVQEDSLTIELRRHQYSPEYIRLTQDFYLNM